MKAYSKETGTRGMTVAEYDRAALKRMFKRRRITESGCWEWTGYTLPDGYGRVRYANESWLVHRLVLLLTRPKEFHDNPQVMHTCDNKLCFNPDHLKGSTQSDNMKDAYYKGRSYLAKRR